MGREECNRQPREGWRRRRVAGKWWGVPRLRDARMWIQSECCLCCLLVQCVCGGVQCCERVREVVCWIIKNPRCQAPSSSLLLPSRLAMALSGPVMFRLLLYIAIGFLVSGTLQGKCDGDNPAASLCPSAQARNKIPRIPPRSFPIHQSGIK